MLFYGVALLPLIKKLHNPTKHKQSFYADDAAACGKFDDLKQWMRQIVDEGPKCGYYLEPKKSFLIVHPDHVDEAKLSTITNIYNASYPQRSLFSLSAKNGGLYIPDPVVKASEQFEMSKKTS